MKLLLLLAFTLLLAVTTQQVGALPGRKQPNCKMYGDTCDDVYDPVCASDGNTYSNECYFCLAKRENKRLRVLWRGECIPIFTTPV